MIDGAMTSGPRVSGEQARARDEEDRRDDHDPGEQRDAEPDPLDEEVGRDPAGDRRGRGRAHRGRPGPTYELVRLAARTNARNIPSLARGSTPLEERVDPGVVLGEDRPLDVGRRSRRGVFSIQPGCRIVASRVRAGRRRRSARLGHGGSRRSRRHHAAVGSATELGPAAEQAGDQQHDAAAQEHPDDPGDLVPDGRVPQVGVGVAEERQRDVVAGQRGGEDRRQVLEALAGCSRRRPGRPRCCPRRRRTPARSGRAGR